MAAHKVGKNGNLKRIQKPNTYFALKSQNELYYQMASIFIAVTRDEEKLEQMVFKKFFPGNSSEIFLENRF